MRKYAEGMLRNLKEDRRNGHTISMLMQKYTLHKTTVWHHIQDVKLTEKGAQIVRASRGGNQARLELRWAAAQARADVLMQSFKEERVWPVLLSALYWAEGTKRRGFVFTNTDEAMIKIFLKLVRKYLGIPDKDIKILVRICAPMKPDVCRQYWSKVTDMSLNSVSTNYHNAYNRSTTTYGMCRITFRKGGNYLKLMHCLTRALVVKMLPHQSLRSSMDKNGPVLRA